LRRAAARASHGQNWASGLTVGTQIEPPGRWLWLTGAVAQAAVRRDQQMGHTLDPASPRSG
jgi:hypothetical protein